MTVVVAVVMSAVAVVVVLAAVMSAVVAMAGTVVVDDAADDVAAAGVLAAVTNVDEGEVGGNGVPQLRVVARIQMSLSINMSFEPSSTTKTMIMCNFC